MTIMNININECENINPYIILNFRPNIFLITLHGLKGVWMSEDPWTKIDTWKKLEYHIWRNFK